MRDIKQHWRRPTLTCPCAIHLTARPAWARRHLAWIRQPWDKTVFSKSQTMMPGIHSASDIHTSVHFRSHSWGWCPVRLLPGESTFPTSTIYFSFIHWYTMNSSSSRYRCGIAWIHHLDYCCRRRRRRCYVFDLSPRLSMAFTSLLS